MLLTKSNAFIIGPFATVLGFIMNGIYLFLDGALGIQNIGICIILFTVIVNLLLLPMTIKTQKSSKMMQVANPEIQALQKKYKNKTDQASQMKMYEEQQALYAKYGISMSGQCLPLLIQFPILLAMYQVIWKIPGYISSVYNIYTELVNKLLTTSGAQEFLTQYASQGRVDFEKSGFVADTIIDVLYNFTPANWTELADKFPGIADVINSTAENVRHINYFLGINIADSPMSIIQTGWSEKDFLAIIVALAIPILAGLTQFLSTKLTPQQSSNTGTEENTMTSSLKTMNTIMPLMSVFFCFTFSVGIGIYWVAGSVVRCVIQVIVNRQVSKIDVDELVKKNLEKYNEKRAKQGLPPDRISGQAKANLKNLKNPVVEDEEAAKAKDEKRLENIKKSTEYYNNTSAKPGSIAAKARMVEQYNEKNNKKKK
ncbi:membrane protein insertase, YidC/Oxa1 family [Marvinbryantia formatexigens DSM 14469]|uniref:Membrane protein insertase, YidC/Oxa1 family n=1 Tax=Marvinbryantia formatexigens DSM 14469 TaxID=478749 RepID=C6LKJ8_9FIRM|nr:YidC/Oxa1 family membrane protein insertase [Marvinbryantia formatexigens]EET58897.1 membrane protein insertase, YidC/Oxa1 family [Marvinbryantia formatexigens DSM 14469]UWO26983.1 YidC/Oxa1 family membrane protein insertase [Marvinbryantia formatexigens DSM 14469]